MPHICGLVPNLCNPSLFNNNVHDLTVTIVENGHGDSSSNPRRDCISYSTNTLEKGMNPTILYPAKE